MRDCKNFSTAPLQPRQNKSLAHNPPELLEGWFFFSFKNCFFFFTCYGFSFLPPSREFSHSSNRTESNRTPRSSWAGLGWPGCVCETFRRSKIESFFFFSLPFVRLRLIELSPSTTISRHKKKNTKGKETAHVVYFFLGGKGGGFVLSTPTYVAERRYDITWGIIRL